MLTSLQEPFLPNPFADTRECGSTPDDTPFDINNPDDRAALNDVWTNGTINGMVIHTKPPVADVVPRFVYIHEMQAMQDMIDSRDAEIATLRKQVGAALKKADEAQMMAQVRIQPVYADSHRDQAAITRLYQQFPEIVEARFEHDLYRNAMVLCVATSDGKNHGHSEQHRPNSDTIGLCEDGMVKFLSSQGYGTPSGAMSQSNSLLSSPRPPGQPPKHDTQINACPIMGCDGTIKPDVFGEYLAATNKAQQQAALYGTGIQKMWMGEEAINASPVFINDFYKP